MEHGSRAAAEPSVTQQIAIEQPAQPVAVLEQASQPAMVATEVSRGTDGKRPYCLTRDASIDFVGAMPTAHRDDRVVYQAIDAIVADAESQKGMETSGSRDMNQDAIRQAHQAAACVRITRGMRRPEDIQIVRTQILGESYRAIRNNKQIIQAGKALAETDSGFKALFAIAKHGFNSPHVPDDALSHVSLGEYRVIQCEDKRMWTPMDVHRSQHVLLQRWRSYGGMAKHAALDVYMPDVRAMPFAIRAASMGAVQAWRDTGDRYGSGADANAWWSGMDAILPELLDHANRHHGSAWMVAEQALANKPQSPGRDFEPTKGLPADAVKQLVGCMQLLEKIPESNGHGSRFQQLINGLMSTHMSDGDKPIAEALRSSWIAQVMPYVAKSLISSLHEGKPWPQTTALDISASVFATRDNCEKSGSVGSAFIQHLLDPLAAAPHVSLYNAAPLPWRAERIGRVIDATYPGHCRSVTAEPGHHLHISDAECALGAVTAEWSEARNTCAMLLWKRYGPPAVAGVTDVIESRMTGKGILAAIGIKGSSAESRSIASWIAAMPPDAKQLLAGQALAAVCNGGGQHMQLAVARLS